MSGRDRSAAVPTLEELIGYELEGTAYWRRLKAEEFPLDDRNLKAAALLEHLASQVADYEGSKEHHSLAESAAWDPTSVFTLLLSDLTKDIGFRRHPKNLPDFFRALFNDITWAGRAGAFEFDDLSDAPSLLIRSVVEVEKHTSEGALIRAVTQPWLEIVKWLHEDHSRAFQMLPRQWEEMIAGAYQTAGFDKVILTPRSGDYGRDIIAEKRGLGTIRIIDQVKAFGPNHCVTADDVRALLGVLIADGASKGFLTTTSSFAPRLHQDPLLSPFVPSRLELVDGKLLMARLNALAGISSD